MFKKRKAGKKIIRTWGAYRTANTCVYHIAEDRVKLNRALVIPNFL